MINNERELFQGLKDLTLSEKARTHMRSELSAYADMHTLPETESAPFNSISFITGIFSSSRPLMAGALALVVVVSTTSATAFASEKALPGDVLYPIKVSVAEPVASVFAGTGVEKARFHAKLAVKRVEEAKTLEARGDLSPEQEVALSERFITETERVETMAAAFEATDPGASIAIRSELAQELDVRMTDEPDTVVAASAMVATEAVDEPMVATMQMAKMAAPEASEEPETFRTIVSKKVAHLRSLQVDARVIAGGEAIRELDQEEYPTVASRGLLSGASAVNADELASTTASSTPEDGTHFIRALLKAKQEAREEPNRQEETAGTAAVPLEAGEILDTVQNPARLVPKLFGQ
jgi:hypothetical protein